MTASLECFLENRLRLKINRNKSAVARPWERKFLGYSVTVRKARLKIAPQSCQRLKAKLRPILRSGRGQNLGAVIREMNPIIRGWIAYFRLAEVKGAIEDLDGWVRRKLRCIVWRQWKLPGTRFRELRRLGLDVERARMGTRNHHGPWWNAGQVHMNLALSTKYLRTQGLVFHRGASTPRVCLMNRRMPTGTYGGVGGGAVTFPPPDRTKLSILGPKLANGPMGGLVSVGDSARHPSLSLEGLAEERLGGA